MSDPVSTYPTVRITFDPYNHDQVQEFLVRVTQDFGRDRGRWYYRSPDVGTVENNVWILEFYFRDPNDAMIFGLKYSR
jgi:hypothetical protein